MRLEASSQARNTTVNAVVVHDLIWVHARPEDRLQHVYVIAGQGRVDLVVFCLSPSFEQARAIAALLCSLACQRSPLLADWHVAAA
jgi:hypothetical protein